MAERCFSIPRRSLGVRTFPNGLRIRTSTKLLIEDTGGDVWRGSIAMASFLPSDHRDCLGGKRVLELASGTGLLGLSLLLAGEGAPSCIVMTDKPNMIELIEANVDENADVVPADRVLVAPLDFFGPVGGKVAEGAPYDTVIVSDVFYDEEIVEPFLRTLRRVCLLSRRGSAAPPIFLCASHRADRIESLFFAAAQPFFAWEDVGEASTVRRQLRGEYISIWCLRMRDDVPIETFAAGLGDGEGAGELGGGDGEREGGGGREARDNSEAGGLSPTDPTVGGEEPPQGWAGRGGVDLEELD